MVKCRTCGATYEREQADGTRYFHACAPLSVPELLELLDAGALKLSAAHQRELDAARERDATDPPADDEPTHVATVLSRWTIARKDHRDENIAIPAVDKRPAVVVAAGKGEPIDVR